MYRPNRHHFTPTRVPTVPEQSSFSAAYPMTWRRSSREAPALYQWNMSMPDSPPPPPPTQIISPDNFTEHSHRLSEFQALSPPRDYEQDLESDASSDEAENDSDIFNNEIGTGATNRFSTPQCRVLVENWVKHIKKLESSESLKYWKIIVIEVNKVGKEKTVKQVKKKMTSYKALYKKAKLNNSRSGRARKTCKFFEHIDSVLGTRDVVNMPSTFSSGRPMDLASAQAYPPNTLINDSTELSQNYTIANDNNSIINTSVIPSTADDNEGNRPKRRKTKNDAINSVNEAMLHMQERQEEFTREFFNTFFDKMVALEERAQEKNNELLLKLVDALKK